VDLTTLRADVHHRGAQDSFAMIHLTRLNNSTVTVNCDLIKFVEQSPDTVITLVSGEKILVQEQVSEIVSAIVEFRRRVLTGTGAWNYVPSNSFPRPISPPPDESEG
jgi:flagellar protein FlbD